MRILIDTYNSIVTFFENNKETEQGGILGSKNRGIIDVFFPDISPNRRSRNVYEPNTMILNKELRKWNDMQIGFCGIVHSHLTETPNLSLTDKEYIENILSVIPSVRKLWFPLVIYKKDKIEIMVYVAEQDENDEVKFYSENLDIV